MPTVRIILLLCTLASVASATNYTVKSGGGGSFTTMGACASQMSTNGTGVSDTCTVFAGTYNENVTIPAGSVGNYKIFNVNGSDVVNAFSFVTNSHNKIVGNCASAPAAANSCGFNIIASSPLNAPCVLVNDGSTDVYITNNLMTSCGSGGHPSSIWMEGTTGVSFVYIQGNTISYGCGTAASPNNCSAVAFNGNHVLIEKNDMAHFGLAVQSFAQFSVIRNNTIHDMNESECGASSGNCHLDVIYAERSNAVAAFLVQYQLWEGNTSTTVTGTDGKGFFTSGDVTSLGVGCSNSTNFLCFNVIGRYNVFAHLGSGAMAHTTGFQYVKYYNNTVVDPGMSIHGSNSTLGVSLDGLSAFGSAINILFYFPFSIATQTWGWDAYNLQSTSNSTGFRSGSNLAYCTVSPCALQVERAGSGASLFPSDPNSSPSNILAMSDPLVNYAGGNFNLAVGSQAINAGTYLTTVASGDTGSGTSLVLNDASFFQDGLGLNAAGVQADCIAVNTSSNHVCVTAVNYSTNTLTLASSISRSSGQGVYLYSKSDGAQVLFSANGDIGAKPFGSQPIATFCFPSVNIGLVPIGLTSNPISCSLQNTGTATLTNTSITLSNALFSLVNNTCGSPATITNLIPGTGFSLGAGASCTFQVTASPTAAGAITANAVFTENTSLGSDTLVLNANATGPPAPTTVMSAGKFATHTLCPVRANMTQLCLAADCNCWWVSMNGAAYTPFGVSSVNGKTGTVVLGIQ